jgi:hypothetical protein
MKVAWWAFRKNIEAATDFLSQLRIQDATEPELTTLYP